VGITDDYPGLELFKSCIIFFNRYQIHINKKNLVERLNIPPGAYGAPYPKSSSGCAVHTFPNIKQVEKICWPDSQAVVLIKWGEEKVGHKPGSVLSTASSFRGQLSIWDACYQTPQAVPKNGTGKKPTIVPPTLLPTGVYRASTSRCCWCALTAPLHPYQI